MRRIWWLAGAAVAVAAAVVILLLWKPWHTPGPIESIDELGYLIEYEYDPETAHLHQSNPDRGGQEYIGVSVQGHCSVMILDGHLTLKGEPFGTVRKGDRIKVTLDRRVWVNGTERRPAK